MCILTLHVLLDANFLALPAEFGIDIFTETTALLEQRVHFIVLESVVNEINSRVSSSLKSRSRIFNVAKDLLKQCEIVSVAPSLAQLPVDEQLLEYAAVTGAVLATNDQQLRRRARERGVPVLILRSKKYLLLDGNVS